MVKKTSIKWILGGLFMVVMIYTAVVFRPFYQQPALQFDPEIPKDAELKIREFFKQRNARPTEDFSFSRALYLMMHPYESKQSPLQIKRTGTVEVGVVHTNRAYVFLCRRGYWEFVFELHNGKYVRDQRGNRHGIRQRKGAPR